MSWFSGDEHQPFECGDGAHAVLLIHGFMGTPAEMRPLGTLLAHAGYRAYGMLQPGFGPDIPWLRSLSSEQWINAALASYDQIAADHESVSVLGFSMGGAVALQIAVRKSVPRLALIAPLWRVLAADRRRYLLPIARHIIGEVRPFADLDFDDPEARQLVAQAIPGLDPNDRELIEQVASQAALPLSAIDELRQLAAMSDSTARQIQVPTLVLQGTDDESVRPEDTRRLIASFTGPVEYAQVRGPHMLVDCELPSWPAVRGHISRFFAPSFGEESA